MPDPVIRIVCLLMHHIDMMVQLQCCIKMLLLAWYSFSAMHQMSSALVLISIRACMADMSQKEDNVTHTYPRNGGQRSRVDEVGILSARAQSVFNHLQCIMIMFRMATAVEELCWLGQGSCCCHLGCIGTAAGFQGFALLLT